MATAPEPHEIYRRTAEEGRRRLSRHPLELAATALVAGFDVVFGVAAYAVVAGAVAPLGGAELAHIVGALAFGIAFVFVEVGRSELFTENFLVPIAGLDRGSRTSWYKLAELWVATPVLNVLGVLLLGLILSAHGVLPKGAGSPLVTVTNQIDAHSFWTASLSAVAAGALITLMTWLAEGAESPGVRVLCAWLVGFLLVAASLNHVIVGAAEMFFGIRFGSPIGWGDYVGNLAVAGVGNVIGGVLFVTLTRLGQAVGSSK